MKVYADINEQDFTDFLNRITSNVVRIRKEKGYSQEQLALAIGHSSASLISKIEARLENKNFNIRQLYLISTILNVSIEDFFN